MPVGRKATQVSAPVADGGGMCTGRLELCCFARVLDLLELHMYGQPVKHKCLYFGVLCFAIPLTFASSPVALAQEQESPAIAPLPRTVNLTQEQRFIIKENVKDLSLPKAPSNAPETIGDIVPENIKLYSLPPLAAKKVAQAKSHLYFVKEGNNAIVLVSPNDRRVADVIH
jgi:hypothetical protein